MRNPSLPMRRVIVIGCPGSGKSTFARELQTVTSLPLHHLDLLYWNEDRTVVSEGEFARRLKSAIEQTAWIIDGNYRNTMEARLQACDTVFFLDYPLEVCLAGIASRIGRPRSDMPWTEERVDPELLELVRRYPEEDRKAVAELLSRYAGEKNIITFHTRDTAKQYLHDLRIAE